MADFLFLNGQVVTADAQNRVAEAVAVQGNRIAAVGSNEEVMRWKRENTQVIDLKGKSLLPGFIDSHLHISIYDKQAGGGLQGAGHHFDCRSAGSPAGTGQTDPARRMGARQLF